MEITLNQSTWLINFEYVIRNFNLLNPEKLNICFGEGLLSFHPVIYSMIGAMALKTIENKGKINISGSEAMQLFLNKDMGLNNIIKGTKKAEFNGKIIPITVIKDDVELKHFIQDIIPLFHCPIEKASPIKYVLSEMIRNVLEHSKSSYGAVVCARYSNKSNRISVGIVDIGSGIFKSLSKSHHVDSPSDALILALTPGITGTTKRLGGTAENAGAGLFFTRSIAKLSKNAFLLYSSNAMYKLRRGKNDQILNPNPQKDNHSLREFPDQIWSGTIVGVDFALDEQPQFETLLVQIRKAYSLDVKNKNKEKYKKPKFI